MRSGWGTADVPRLSSTYMSGLMNLRPSPEHNNYTKNLHVETNPPSFRFLVLTRVGGRKAGGRTRGLFVVRRAGRRADKPKRDSGGSESGNAYSLRVWHAGGTTKIQFGRHQPDGQNPGCATDYTDSAMPNRRLKRLDEIGDRLGGARSRKRAQLLAHLD